MARVIISQVTIGWAVFICVEFYFSYHTASTPPLSLPLPPPSFPLCGGGGGMEPRASPMQSSSSPITFPAHCYFLEDYEINPITNLI